MAGLVLLRREGYRLTINAPRPHPLALGSGSECLDFDGVVFCFGDESEHDDGASQSAVASAPGFVPPEWWPAASNPTIPVNSASDAFPDISWKAISFVFLYFVVGLLFNIFGEELYYRGFIAPHAGVFGRWDWVANGVLFTLKHAYQRWLYPGILIGGLSFCLRGRPLGSLPLAMVFHWVGNLFNMIFLITAALGIT